MLWRPMNNNNMIIIDKGKVNIKVDDFVNMKSKGMWQNIKGMQIGKDTIEIVCISEEIKNKINTNGVNTHGQLLLARSEMPVFVNVSLTGCHWKCPRKSSIDIYPNMVKLRATSWSNLKSWV